MSSEDSGNEEKETGETEGDPDHGSDASTAESKTAPEPNPTAFEETESVVTERSGTSEPASGDSDDSTAVSEPDEQNHTHDPSDTELAADEVYCTSCGEPIKAAAEVCPNCGVRQTESTPAGDSTTGEGLAPADQKEPVLAGILSFIIPGAGQLYNGQVGRAIAAFLGVIIGDVILFTVGSLLLVILIGAVFFLLMPVIHVLVAYDAYNQANKINRGEVVP